MKTHSSLNPFKSRAVLAALLLAAPGLPAAGEGAESVEPERIAVLFYADWCGSCEVLDPKIKEARSELEADAKTLFVTFDLTDDAARAQTAMLAETLGLGSIYEAHGGKTGFMLVVDADDPSILHKLTKTDDVATIRTRLAAR